MSSHKTMREFETESDLRTIKEAREITKDKKRMDRVHALLMKEKKAFEELSEGLRSRTSSHRMSSHRESKHV